MLEDRAAPTSQDRRRDRSARGNGADARGALREFFVLIAGKARVSKKDKKIAEIGSGDWFGEIALLTDSPRTATVTATSPVDVLVITDRRFREVVETMPSIALKVLACVGDRLASDARS